MGPVGVPRSTPRCASSAKRALVASMPVIEEHWAGLAKVFGREYKPIESYKTEGAETILITMGSISETAMTAIDQMQADGKKVGLVRIRLWRPFPTDYFKEAIKGAKQLVVIDRALSTGGAGGPVATELRALLYNTPNAPKMASYIAGLGGRDVRREDFIEMVEKAADQISCGKLFEFHGFREDAVCSA